MTCTPSPLSTLSASSTIHHPTSTSTFLQDIETQSARFSQLPYIIQPPTLPPLSPAARQRIATIQQRCLANIGRNAPEIFLASCRPWRGELPFGWPDEYAARRRDEDVQVMQWKHALPMDKEELEVWRAEWKESRKSENRSTFGAPIKKRQLQGGRSLPDVKAEGGSRPTPPPVPHSLPTIREPARPSILTNEKIATASSTSTPNKRKASQTTKSSHTLSGPALASASVTVLRTMSQPQQQMIPFSSAKPSSLGSGKSKVKSASASFVGMEVEVEVEQSFHGADEERAVGLKRSWSDIGDMTVFQDFLPPSFPSHLAQSTPPANNKRRRPEAINAASAAEGGCSRTASPSPEPMWGAQGTQTALDGIDEAAGDVEALMAFEGDEFERGMMGDL